MAYRLYIVPSETVTQEGEPLRIAKYFHPRSTSPLTVSPWLGMYYGFQPIYLVAADLAAADDANIAGQTDVDALPFDLSPTVGGGNVQAARAALEAALIPAQWVNGQMTWLTVARMVAGMFQYMQRVYAITGPQLMLDSSAKLNAQWSQIPVDPWQNAILAAANSFSYDTSFIRSNTQVRVILQNFAQDWGSVPFYFGQFVI
jgi:hypothetical protein